MTEISSDDGPDEGGELQQRDLEDALWQSLASAVLQVRAGGVAAASWGLFLLVCAAVGYFGLSTNSSPVYWDLVCGYALLVGALAGTVVRSRAVMALLALLAVVDLPVQVVSIGSAMAQGIPDGLPMASARVFLLPGALYLILRGYRGAVDYQRLRGGASPRNWRLWGPLPFVAGFVLYSGAVVSALLYWTADLRQSFQTPGAELHASAKSDARQARSAGERGIDARPFRESAGNERSDASQDSPNEAYSTAAELEDPAALPEAVREAAEQGRIFGANTDNAGCLAEGLRRYDACSDGECRLLAKVFLTACLPESQPDDGFCIRVPSPASVVETAAWRARVCDASGRAPVPCYEFFLSLQNFCHPGVGAGLGGGAAGGDKALRRLKSNLDADLRSTDVKRFRKPERYAATDATSPAGGLATLPTPVREVVDEGTAFAAQADNVGCLAEALRRHDACPDDECRLLAKVFFTACLSASRPTKDFCKGVPSPLSLVETTAWRTRVCDQSGRAPAACGVFFLSLQDFCHPEAVAQQESRIRDDQRALRRLMRNVRADLRSIDVQGFSETGKSAPAAGKASGATELSEALATLPAPVREALEQATAFAAKVEDAACFSEALRRHDACSDDKCRLLSKLFLTACLSASRVSKDFCVGVPAPNAIVETTAWRGRICDRNGRLPAACGVFLLSLQNFCNPDAVEP